MKTKNTIPSVNFHLWEPCNFSCKFCFATFQDVKKTLLPKGHLPKKDALTIVNKLSEAGFSKITFVGGEPTLCPWIGDLILRAKVNGLTTMIVTNGSGITEQFLNTVYKSLDWVVISIDSLLPGINKVIGRSNANRLIPDESYYSEKVKLVHQFGIKLKINTVVNKYNFQDESLSDFIHASRPKRWKVFKALKVIGQNDEFFNDVNVNDEQFEKFLSLNKVTGISYAVIEDNEDMTGTYAMVDPAGRFFDNTNGAHTYSNPILEVGVDAALKEITVYYSKFLERGGLYDW